MTGSSIFFCGPGLTRHSGPDSEPGPSSVLELLRPEDRERLLSIRTASNVPASKTTPAVLPAGPPSVGRAVSSGLQQEALAAWRDVQTSSQTFRPFEKNPSKQARYELYLDRLRQGDQGRSTRSQHAPQHTHANNTQPTAVLCSRAASCD